MLAEVRIRHTGLVAEIVDLHAEGAFTFWEWWLGDNSLATRGAMGAGSLEEWIRSIHPRDRTAFSEFLDREWEGSPCASIDYRFATDGMGDWRAVRHTARLSDRAEGRVLAGIVEELSSPQHSRTLLERTEGEFREGEARFSSFVRGLLGCPPHADPGPLLELVRSTLRADVAVLVPYAGMMKGNLAAGAAVVGGGTFDDEPLKEALGSVPLKASPLANDVMVELDLDAKTCRTAWFSARFLRDDEGGALAALCVGHGTVGSRLASRPLAPILALAAEHLGRSLRGSLRVSQQRDLLAHLRQAQRLSSFARVAAGYAHELRNLLTLVHGHLHLVEDAFATGDREAGGESLRQIRRAAAEAAESSERLLGLGSAEAPERIPCDINRIVERFAAMMQRIVEENVALRLDLDPRVPKVFADERLLRDALVHLLVDVRDSLPNGGRVPLSTRPVAARSGAGTSSFVCLRIGERSACEEVERRPGTPGHGASAELAAGRLGLDLHHAAAIVAEHQGRIEAFVTPEGGRGFELLLPIAGGVRRETREAGDKPRRVGAKQIRNLRGETVLLVEDEDAVRKLVRKLLERLGCSVVEAASGREALDLWPGLRERVDLVVSDVVMPGGVSGWDLARELHQRHPELGILLTTGYAEGPEDHGLGGIERIGYLQKPYSAAALQESLSRLARPGGQ